MQNEGLGEVRLAEDGADRGVEDVSHELVDDLLESLTDDDTDGHLDDVAASDEFLEALKHGISCVKGRLCRQV